MNEFNSEIMWQSVSLVAGIVLIMIAAVRIAMDVDFTFMNYLSAAIGFIGTSAAIYNIATKNYD